MRKIFFKLYIFCQTVNSRYWKNEVHLGIWRASVSVKMFVCVCVYVFLWEVQSTSDKIVRRGLKRPELRYSAPLGPLNWRNEVYRQTRNKKRISVEKRDKTKQPPGLEAERPVTEKAFSYFVQTPLTTPTALAQDLPASCRSRHNQTRKQLSNNTKSTSISNTIFSPISSLIVEKGQVKNQQLAWKPPDSLWIEKLPNNNLQLRFGQTNKDRLKRGKNKNK